MILAGIDEAGLGPALGPLCVCASAFRVPDDWDAATPWEALKGIVSRKKGTVTVADSKVAYRAGGMKTLETAVLTFLSCQATESPDNRDSLLTLLGSNRIVAELQSVPWYRNSEWSVPGWQAPDDIKVISSRLKAELEAAHAEAVFFQAQVLSARMLNLSFASLNKSETVIAETGAHLVAVSSAFPNEEMEIVVDKQGGRNKYLPLLCDLFPGAWIDMLLEGADCSSYLIRRAGGDIKVIFRPRADDSAFAVALASMCAKYLRERFMDDFNSYFQKRIPGLTRTAGYHGDAPRFLAAIEDAVKREGIDRSILVRER